MYISFIMQQTLCAIFHKELLYFKRTTKIHFLFGMFLHLKFFLSYQLLFFSILQKRSTFAGYINTNVYKTFYLRTAKF